MEMPYDIFYDNLAIEMLGGLKTNYNILSLLSLTVVTNMFYIAGNHLSSSHTIILLTRKEKYLLDYKEIIAEREKRRKSGVSI